MTNARLDLEAWDLNTDRFLYLDSDTLTAQRPDLPSQLTDGIAVAGAVDAVIPTHGDLARLRGDLNAPWLFTENSQEAYVNAGVLLVDVAEWERQGVGDACMELISAFPQLSDQDALNLVLAGKKDILAPRVNAQTAQRAWRSGRSLGDNVSQAGPRGYQPQVIHFTADKPWKAPRPRPSHAKWMKFLLGQLPQPSENVRWLARSLSSRRA